MNQQIVWTASITPFAKNNIDFESFEKILRFQESVGNGIVLLGSTGEGISLDVNEKKAIVEFACQLGLKTQLLVGVPSHNMSCALEWLDFCRDMPIHGYLMTTPIYTKPGIIGQTQWFDALLNHAYDRPCMLYNVPGRTGVKLYDQAVKNLKDHDAFWAIKDSSGTIESIVKYKIAAPNIDIYCGDDYMMPAMASEESCGLVSVASNVWPSAWRQYVKACLDGKPLSSKLWYQTSKALFTASNPIPVKALMKDIGLIKDDCVRLPLSMGDLPSRQTLLDYHSRILDVGLINDDYARSPLSMNGFPSIRQEDFKCLMKNS